MSLGSIFVGLAIAVMVIAYIVRPFRTASGAAAARTDKLIEAWVRAAPGATPGAKDTDAPVSVAVPAPTVAATPIIVPQVAPPSAAALSAAVNFCPQCGRRVTADYRFCPGCGALLPHEEGASSGDVA
jgi:hypothetical protein